MKTASLIARYLMGFIFLVFGLNGFFHFLPMPPPTGLAGTYLTVLSESHYVLFIFAVQLIGGILMLIGQYIPMALTLLAPVIVNILLFHITMAPAGLPLAILVTILWLLVYLRYRENFAGLFANRNSTV